MVDTIRIVCLIPLKTFLAGVIASIPLAIGYLPMAFSFGIVAMQAELTVWQSVAMSVVVFAGAAQFVMASMLAAGSGGGAVVAAVLALNLRHLFYGPALLARLRPSPGRTTPLLAFVLTDEVFATAMARAGRDTPHPVWTLGVGAGAYSAWVTGTLLGAVSGSSVSSASPFLADALSFVLPALFIALLVQAWQWHRWAVVTGAAVIAIATGLWLPAHLAMLAGMVGGALFAKWPTVPVDERAGS